jgi:hypothetical protein
VEIRENVSALGGFRSATLLVLAHHAPDVEAPTTDSSTSEDALFVVEIWPVTTAFISIMMNLARWNDGKRPSSTQVCLYGGATEVYEGTWWTLIPTKVTFPNICLERDLPTWELGWRRPLSARWAWRSRSGRLASLRGTAENNNNCYGAVGVLLSRANLNIAKGVEYQVLIRQLSVLSAHEL